MKHLWLLASILISFVLAIKPSSDAVAFEEIFENKSLSQIRDKAIWEAPDCESCCPVPSGRPISYWRLLECAKVQVKPYGFIQWEGYWDTRQTIGSREEDVMLFPAPYKPDVLGEDINDHGKWHMASINTRMGLQLLGPQWGDITVNGRIEGDFRGASEVSIACFRLRMAYGQILWENGSFVFGQWWHPLFIVECFPHTIAFSIGAPMELQARDPQLRLTQRWDWFELIVAAASQRDFASNGPIGVSSEYIRNAVVPNVHLQARAYVGSNLFGVAADYKRIVPRIVSNLNFKVDEYIDSFIVEGFAAFNQPPWSLRLKAYWAQNANDQLLISGFGVRTRDPITDCRSYANTAAVGAWLDFSYIFGCDNQELGLFVGGTKNLGSRHSLYLDPATEQPIIYALTAFGPQLDQVVRVSPRYIFMKDPIRFGAELEWTRASFGNPNRFGRICDGRPVDNFRITMVLYYMF